MRIVISLSLCGMVPCSPEIVLEIWGKSELRHVYNRKLATHRIRTWAPGLGTRSYNH